LVAVFFESVFCGGNGTQSNPFQICTAEDLAALADMVNAGGGNETAGIYYIVMNNLDLIDYTAGEGWMPIGNNSTNSPATRFQGHFDGNGKVITNLVINRPTGNFQGLFGYASNATITRLGIENCKVRGNDYVGGLIGYSE